MKFLTHSVFGVFTALLIFFFTQDLIAALVVFIIQIVLILDFIFKKVIKFEPLHTIIAMSVVWALSFLFFPKYNIYVLFFYFSYLFLDIFVKEDIPLLYPFKKKLMYPINHSEEFVTYLSLIGIVILIILLI